MTIVVTGGGSGGHITPILAVASQLKRLQPGVRVVYIGQTGDKLADIPAADPNVDAVYTVRAGKFRRYHGEGWKQLLDVSTQLKNLRDGFFVLVGLWQSFWLLRRLKPQVIFTRGGFVSVPVALGGKLNGVPYITHDSDTVPSLANRIIAKWASLHAVALPEELYPYPRKKTLMVGIPLSADYQRVNPKQRATFRKQLGLEKYEQLLLVTGGGNGADQLNKAVIANSADLLKQYPKLALIHIAGRDLQGSVSEAYDQSLTEVDRKRVWVEGFITDFYRYSGAADVIVARGGATNLAEFAAQGKACVIIPAGQLVGGHQLKNAQALAERGAVVVLTEEQADQERRLAYTIHELLSDPARCEELENSFAKFARTDAAQKLAQLLLKIAEKRSGDQNVQATKD